MFVWQIPESLETRGHRNVPWEILNPLQRCGFEQRWIESLEGTDEERHCQKRGRLWAAPGKQPQPQGWGWGNVVLWGRMLIGWIQQNMCCSLPGSAQQPGVAQQCLNLSWNWTPWENPDLGATSAVGHWWVRGQAVGSTYLEKWEWISGKKRPVAGYLIHGEEKNLN